MTSLLFGLRLYPPQVLTEELDKKYANKVIADVGMCICVHDVTSVSDAVIYPAEGAAHHPLVVRLLVFRPFAGEVCVGTIVGATEEGVKVSLDFFDEVFIPAFLLPQPAVYDARAKLWVWKYEGSEEGGIFSLHEQVCVCVCVSVCPCVRVFQRERKAVIRTGISLFIRVVSTRELDALCSQAKSVSVPAPISHQPPPPISPRPPQVRFRVERISYTAIEPTPEGRRANTSSTEAGSLSLPVGVDAGDGASAARTSSGVDMRSGVGKAGAGGGGGGVAPAAADKALAPGKAAPALRQRSTSVDLSADVKDRQLPPAMQVIASVNDHGLGLVCWNWE